MPWPIFQILIRNTFNFYSIKNYKHISFYAKKLPKIGNKQIIPPFNIFINSLLKGISTATEFCYLFLRMNLSKNLQNKRIFINKIGTLSINNCQYGDLLLSKHLRSPIAKGSLSFSLAFFVTLLDAFFIPFIYGMTKLLIKKASYTDEEFRIILIIPEFVRFSQFLRRVIYDVSSKLNIQVNELYFNPKTNQFEIKRFLDAFEYVLSTRAIRKFDIDKDIVDEYWEKLKLRLYTNKHEHAHTANLYKNFDIDSSLEIDNTLKQFLSNDKPTLFFPLHQVADSQFEWGFDDFGDIGTFNKTIIEFCIKKNYRLIVKPHPMGFSTVNLEKYKIETNYFKYLIRKYFFNEYSNQSQIINDSYLSKLNQNLILVSHKYPLTKIFSYSKSPMLTITRHGNIVIESFAANIPCVSSRRSRYYNFNMPNRYDELSTLFNIIDNFFINPSSVKLLDEKDIKYLAACAVFQRKYSFEILTDKIVRYFFPNSFATSASVEKMKYIHKKLRIENFLDLESTRDLKKKTIKFLELIEELLLQKD